MSRIESAWQFCRTTPNQCDLKHTPRNFKFSVYLFSTEYAEELRRYYTHRGAGVEIEISPYRYATWPEQGMQAARMQESLGHKVCQNDARVADTAS